MSMHWIRIAIWRHVWHTLERMKSNKWFQIDIASSRILRNADVIFVKVVLSLPTWITKNLRLLFKCILIRCRKSWLLFNGIQFKCFFVANVVMIVSDDEI
uniref:Uncharacterized protein n=1 Tax=Octactis speculum TaxID=3111310 RepID=A0A7S2H6J5_9STRA|mmetsp:Transcript_6186/g.7683  ORF Transcript_6186/g.7683 Transcript_6186/m.7683 type:complete len:100 (+) Transcript_6186:50-349(+)